MARNDTGKWVARAAATGGGRTYRGQRPTKWYASLVLICIVGVALIWLSRYQRQNPSSSGQPAIGTHWVAALSFDLCGTTLPVLPTNPNATAQITTQGDGLIHISPTTSDNAGANATLGKFAGEYPGLTLTSTSVRYPGQRSSSQPTVGKTFTDDEKCPAGTRFAGQQGQLTIQVYPTFTAKTPVTADDPDTFRLGNGQLITVAFLPNAKPIPKPPGTTITLMLQTMNQNLTGSTTTAPSVSVPSTPATSTPLGKGTTGSGSTAPSGQPAK
ncbi:MAG TPA: hypothetical protein VEJ87_08825 [Acidimicrobiales bacterium]|nr:hypothetical protein [Acidimicrobiales bacterium]